MESSKTFNNNKTFDIAVVGIGCHYPGSHGPLQLWENILCKKKQFRRILDARLPLSDYYDADKSVADKIYSKRAAYIDGFDFDWVNRRIPKKTFEGTDIVQWLALETADQALQDAGYTRETVPKEGTGVILGNSLTGEQTRSNNLRLRWPFVRKTMLQTARALEMDDQQINKFVSSCEQVYKSAFPEVDEDTLQGGLANTIAGRVANYFDLDGGGYVVDGACSSSLLAVCTAASQLVNGDIDLALAGGVDISLDTFELIGFAKTGALTENEMNVYDKRGKGFIPGEGSGFVVLKRLSDAEKNNDNIYAVIKGWGISSDGKGGITAPSSQGQAKALIKAYHKAGYSPCSLDFIEGHGTGTALGDLTELKGIALAMNEFGSAKSRSCGMTSLKSILGHTKAAAGIAAFIKATMAVNRRVIPPTAGCSRPHPVFNKEALCLYPVIQGTKSSQSSMRCGVSAMGFGGINSHVTLEASANIPSLDKLAPALDEDILMATDQSSELFIFNALTRQEMSENLVLQAEEARLISLSELVDYSAFLKNQLIEQQNNSSIIKVAIIAKNPDELSSAMLEVSEKFNNSTIPTSGIWSNTNQTIFVSSGFSVARVSFLFPGQGSQFLTMGRELINRYPWAAELISLADRIANVELGFAISPFIFRDLELACDELQIAEWKTKLSDTKVAQPCICLVSLLYLRLLKELGVKPDNVCGHSLGELMAFYAAGVFDEEALLTLACIRGRLMAKSASNSDGSMASLSCSVNIVQELIEQISGYITVANLNSPLQTIVSGEVKSVEQILMLAQQKGINASLLSVSGAFHSSHMNSAAKEFKEFIPESGNWNLSANLYSSIDGKAIDSAIDIKEHFSTQITQQVNFAELTHNILNNSDVLIEVGPGRILSGLIKQNSKNKEFCLPVSNPISPDQSFNKIVANLFVSGLALNIDLLFTNRLVRPYIPVLQKHFIQNPCERPLKDPEIVETNSGLSFSQSLLKNLDHDLHDLKEQQITEYMARRGDFIAEIIKADIDFATDSKTIVRDKPEVNANNVNVQKSQIPEQEAKQDISSLKFEDQLINWVVDETGFPPESINLDMRLLDDLNLDSIKSGQLVGKVFNEIEFSGDIDPASFANASLKEILAVVQADNKNQENFQSSSVIAPSNRIEDLIISKVAVLTGYPVDSISIESRLLDDLNLDSIKTGQLIAEIIQHYGIDSDDEIQNYSNSKISEIVEFVISNSKIQKTQLNLLESQSGSGDLATLNSITNTTSVDVSSNQVRNYVIEYEPQLYSVSDKNDLSYLKEESILVLSDSSQQSALVEILNDVGKQHHAQIFLHTYQNIATSYSNLPDITKVIGVLAQEGAFKSLDQAALTQNITQLDDIFKTAQKLNCTDISYVQFGGGYFGEQSLDPIPQNSSVSGYVRSVFLENPDFNIRVLDFSKQLDNEKVVTNILNNLQITGLTNVGYNKENQRLIPTVKTHQPEMMESRNIVWGEQDVIMITGGAKGITAECAIKLGKETRAKIALVGSTKISAENKTANDEISSNLNKLKALDIDCAYYSCNLTDKQQVSKMMSNITAELGVIKGIVHGAGINKMRRVDQVSREQAMQEVAPKIMGMRHILDAIIEQRLDPPQLIVGFSSIIGITGMAGNAWYAYSNETLNLMLREYHTLNPSRRVISLAYSVWGEVGMGHRMGVIDNLDKSGVGAIPTEQGVKRFWQLFEKSSGHQQVIIAGSLAGLDTWKQLTRDIVEMPSNRFIEDITQRNFGLSLAVKAKLSLEKDRYLIDHNFRNSYLFPTVMGLEAMTQAVCIATNLQADKIIGFSDIKLSKPIVVDPAKGETISINALINERDLTGNLKVNVEIGCAQTSFKLPHFSAIVEFGQQREAMTELIPVNTLLPINPISDLYGKFLFQGPLFQRMNIIYHLSKNEVIFSCEAREYVPSGENGFSEMEAYELLLGDAFYRDVLLQSVQLPATPNIVLPISIGKIEFYGNRQQRCGEMLVRAVLKFQEDRDYIWDVTVTNQTGQVTERLIDYRVRTVNDPSTKNKSSVLDLINEKSPVSEKMEEQISQLAMSYLGETGLKDFSISVESCNDIARLPLKGRREFETPIVAKTLANLDSISADKNFNIELSRTESGKPKISTLLYRQYDVSISHDKDFCMVSVGKNTQGCDIEPVEKRKIKIWKELLSGRRLEMLDKLLIIDSRIDHSGTRLWVALESAVKALGHWNFTLELESSSEGVFVFGIQGDGLERKVITSSFSYPGYQDRMLGFVIQRPVSNRKPLQTTFLYRHKAA